MRDRIVMRRLTGRLRAAGVSAGIGLLVAGGCAFIGHCRVPVSLTQAVALPTLEQACPTARADALCTALRAATAGGDAGATALNAARVKVARIVAERLESGNTDAWDAAVRFYVRERVLGLVAWYVIMGSNGSTEPPSDYERRVSAVLARHFPSYPQGTFPIASLWLPPLGTRSQDCPEDRDLLLILPGVARILSRNEFAVQMDALRAHFPCLLVERVNTLSFIDPAQNANRVQDAIARHPEATRLHFFGYSQGGLNALATLIQSPDIAARTRTVTFLDVPAHGSDVGEALYRALRPAGWFDWLWPKAPLPQPMDAAAQALSGLSGEPDQLEVWLREEGAGQQTLGEFLRQRIAGVRSLGTTYARAFWAENGDRVPHTPLYAEFRAIITDPGANLPPSNALFYAFTNDVAPREPYNDMQVRLVSQAMGGPLADYEVVGPVAEGNHWQWALVPGDVPDAVIPSRMTETMPHTEMLLAYYSTFAEIGLLGGPPSLAFANSTRAGEVLWMRNNPEASPCPHRATPWSVAAPAV